LKTITITKGSVRVPCHSCSSITTVNVKQKKFQGTHDAERLRGKPPKNNHLAIIRVMGNETLTVEQMRYKVNKNRRYPIKQAHFQRFHSELLYWKILIKTVEKISPPTYILNKIKSKTLLDSGRFS